MSAFVWARDPLTHIRYRKYGWLRRAQWFTEVPADGEGVGESLWRILKHLFNCAGWWHFSLTDHPPIFAFRDRQNWCWFSVIIKQLHGQERTSLSGSKNYCNNGRTNDNSKDAAEEDEEWIRTVLKSRWVDKWTKHNKLGIGGKLLWHGGNCPQ